MSDTENSGLEIPQFRYTLTAEDEICLNCTAPGKLCTGGEGMCPIGCQFYKPVQYKPLHWQQVIQELAGVKEAIE